MSKSSADPANRTLGHPHRLAQILAAAANSGTQQVSITWLNHYSAQRVLQTEPDALRHFTYVGIDGVLLQAILHGRHRTSADLVLPDFFSLVRDARIALIGGTREAVQSAASAIRMQLHSTTEIVLVLDGYDGLLRRDNLQSALAELKCNVVIVGLGAGLQEVVAREAAGTGTVKVVATCGGFFDQVQEPGYYPRWAYPLRLNWAVRLAREPRRLWRRYTIFALTAFRSRRELKREVLSAEGFLRLTDDLATQSEDPR